MYKVVVVDDDVNVRIQLKELFSFSLPGFELVGDAGDGREALVKIEMLHPHIVLLDIEMPMMGGLETLSVIAKTNPQCKIIVLSCHDDYSNVRMAMKTGASEYLLKQDMVKDTLACVLAKVAEEIEADKKKRNEIFDLKALADDSAPAIRANLVMDLVKGYITDDQLIQKRLGFVKSDIPLKSMVVCCLQLEDYYRLNEKFPDWSEELLIFSVENVINELIQKNVNAIYGKTDGKTHYIFWGYNSETSFYKINNDIYELLSCIGEELMRSLNIGMTAGVSGIFHSTGDIADNALRALQTAECRFYLGRGRIIHYSETLKYTNSLGSKKSMELAQQITSVVSQGGDIEKTLLAVYNEIRDAYIAVRSVKKFNTEVITALQWQLRKLDADDELSDTQGLPYETINSIDTLEEMKEWLFGFLKGIYEVVIGRQASRSGRSEIIKAKEYIEDNYQRKLSLEKVARHVNLNRTYFSELFKKETGVSFVDYLSMLRLEKAKDLLSTTDCKVYEVAMKVGFDNYRYFTRLFKDIVGRTPLEYRRMNQ